MAGGKRKKRTKSSTTPAAQPTASGSSQPNLGQSAPSGQRVIAVIGLLGLLAAASVAYWIFFSGSEYKPLTLPDAPPNVLLISIDTLRADHLGTYGAKIATPNIDALGQSGVVFEWAVSHVPVTLPSHTSMLTGTYPVWHGIRDNGSFRLREAQTTIAETLRDAGYRTGAFVGSFALDSRFGLDQGFEHYDDFYGDASEFSDFGISERTADKVAEPALDWISRQGDGRWFAFVHLYDPHAPYAPPQPFRNQYPQDPYTGEVVFVDAVLGKLWSDLRERGMLDNTLVIVTSDHGEGLGEHGESTHGMFAYEATLRVPLVMAWDGVLPAETRVASRVRLVDIAPSIAELTGAIPENPRGPPYQGASLLPLMTATAASERTGHRESYFEAMSFNLNRNWAPLTGLYRGTTKFIDLPIPELYDLQADPHETENIIGSRAGSAREMFEALEELVADNSTEATRQIQTAEVDKETVSRLQALGYVVAPREPSEQREYTEEDDPKRLVHLSDRLDEGVAKHLAGQSKEAVALFRSILEERPNFANAYANLAYVLRDMGDLPGAIAVLEQAIERGVQTRTMLGRLGAYLQEAGQLEQSVALLESLVEAHPTYAEAFNFLSVSYARLGRTGDAVAALEKLIALDDSYASAYSNLGSVYLGAGRVTEAEASFQKALSIDPRLAGAWNGLGVIAIGQGKESEAIDAWKRCIEIDPRQYDTLYNLGTLLTKLNRFSEAIPYLAAFVETAPPDQYREDIPKMKHLVEQLRQAARS